VWENIYFFIFGNCKQSLQENCHTSVYCKLVAILVQLTSHLTSYLRLCKAWTQRLTNGWKRWFIVIKKKSTTEKLS